MRGSSPCLLVGSSVLGLGNTVRCLTTALQYALVNMLLFFVSLFRMCLWAQVVLSPSRAGTLLTSDS